MKTLKYYFKKAEQQKFAIGQFNFSDFSQVKGIVEAAKKLKAPIILGTSEGESKFVGIKEAVAMRNVLRKETGLPIFLNLDHGKSLDYLKEVIAAGYDMVHFDGSKLDFLENAKTTQNVIRYAKRKGILVEGEMGNIGTESSKVYEEKFEIKEEDLTKPEEAKKYLAKTKANLLAISVGTFHGVDSTGTSPHIRIDRLKEIKKELGSTYLVLHGGSGTPEEDIREAIKQGIVKININTELRLAFANALKATLCQNNEITPYKYLPEAIRAVETIVEAKIKLFGSVGKA